MCSKYFSTLRTCDEHIYTKPKDDWLKYSWFLAAQKLKLEISQNWPKLTQTCSKYFSTLCTCEEHLDTKPKDDWLKYSLFLAAQKWSKVVKGGSPSTCISLHSLSPYCLLNLLHIAPIAPTFDHFHFWPQLKSWNWKSPIFAEIGPNCHLLHHYPEMAEMVCNGWNTN